MSQLPTPPAKSSGAVKALGVLTLIILAVAVILLGLDVIHFEPSGWWN